MRSLAVAVAVGAAAGIYLPGQKPVDYAPGEVIPLFVNKIWSAKTQLPYQYYSLPFCQPAGGIQTQSENIGQVLVGDRVQNTDFEVSCWGSVRAGSRRA